MKFSCQKRCAEDLERFSRTDCHSVVVHGPQGSGKTHMCLEYAKLVGASDVVRVAPKVSDLKESFDELLHLDNKVLLLVENLDLGVKSCSYVLLKYMEEPKSNVYVCVTCQNVQSIPDTVVSRSLVTYVQVPTKNDIASYSCKYHKEAFEHVKRCKIWKCVKTFSDADSVCSMTPEQISYVQKWQNLGEFSRPVATSSWNMSHYNGSSPLDASLVVKYVMMCNEGNKHVVSSCVRCLDMLRLKRVAPYMALSKLAFDLKYCE